MMVELIKCFNIQLIRCSKSVFGNFGSSNKISATLFALLEIVRNSSGAKNDKGSKASLAPLDLKLKEGLKSKLTHTKIERFWIKIETFLASLSLLKIE